MALRLLVAISLLAATQAHAVISCFANTKISAFAGNSPAIDTTGATLLVVVSAGYINPAFPSDSAGNIWQMASPYGAAGGYPVTTIFYVPAPTTSATHTFTLSQQATFSSGVMYACSGTATSYPLALQNGLLNTGTHVFQPGSVTPAESGDLIVTGAALQGAVYSTASIDSGFSTPVTNHLTSFMGSAASFLVTTSATAVNPTWTMDSGSNWSSAIAVFKSATATPPPLSGVQITKFSGVGRFFAFSGDGGAALSAQLYWPGQIVFDSAKNLYFADINNNRIRVINRQGTTQTLLNVSVCAGCIQTVAGNGTQGFSGDTFAATSAKLAHPVGLAIDGSGNIYIADQQNNRIRKVSTAGIITTVAGSGASGGCIGGSYTGDGGPATSAGMFCPQGVALDSNGNIFISDTNNSVIRAVNTQGSTQTLMGVSGIASGNIQTVAGGSTTDYFGDGTSALNAGLYWPLGLGFDGSGNLYIADYFHYAIRKITPAGIISTFAGTGTAGYSGDGGAATSAQLKSPYDVKSDGAGNIYIADTQNSLIRRVGSSGAISTLAGSYAVYGANAYGGYGGDGGPARLAGFAASVGQSVGPVGIAIDNLGNVFVGDTGNNVIREITPAAANIVGGPKLSGGITLK